MKLTSKAIVRLELPAGKIDHIEFDDELPGFGFRLRRSGDRVLRSWVCQYRAHGRTRRVRIPVELFSAEQARAQAKQMLAQVHLGQDPQGAKAAARLKATRTLRSVVDQYLETKQVSLRPASFRVTNLYLTGRPYFGPLHSAALGEITRADVAARIGAIARKSGTVTASRARSALNTMFAWAMGEGLAENNPVVGTNKPADSTPRDRVLTDTELAAIWAASGDDDYGKVLKLLILTAARRGEIAGMRWSELDLDKGLWALPKERAKNKRALLLPLSPLALAIIQSVPERVDRDQLFGDRAASGFTQWNLGRLALNSRLPESMGPWRPHDLRRTAATRMGDLGVQPHVIEAILNHYSGFRSGVSGTYNLSLYAREMRTALTLWANHVASLVEGGGQKIVPLRSIPRPCGTP
jgi:integrase